MNKVRITILKTTLDEELAGKYGIEGLGPCPLMRKGQVFYADYAKPEGFAMKRGKPSISMCSRWRMAPIRDCFITETGSGSQASPSAAATTACVRSS